MKGLPPTETSIIIRTRNEERWIGETLKQLGGWRKQLHYWFNLSKPTPFERHPWRTDGPHNT